MTTYLRHFLTIVGFLSFLQISFGQSASFFSDSNQKGYYDSGLAFPSGASSLKQAGPSGDKIPTSEDRVYSGSSSLEINWTSRNGGDWAALIIAPGFPFQDITATDFLSFYVFSETPLFPADMPLLYFEGDPGNAKSNRIPLSAFANGIPAQSWTQILVPLDTFFNDPNQTNIDFSKTKAVILGQNAADGNPHTLFVDEVRTFTSAAVNDPVDTPTNFEARGYDSHIELSWTASTSPSTVGYHIFRSEDQGQTFRLFTYVPFGDSLYIDFVGFGDSTNYQYKIAAVNGGGKESSLSATSSAQTRPLNEEEMLDMVQRYTFRYFYDFAHPVSGMARERNTSGDTVTSGGSGFGIMALLVGIERNYISRAEGKARLEKIVNFLKNADRFRGAWAHWMDGNTGEVIPFSPLDNGGDIVETAFLVQGLLTAREYFDQPADSTLRADITTLWEGVNWNWYRKTVQKVIFWHWSPQFDFDIDLEVRGFNETHIVYLLAIASPTNGVPASLYDDGWAGGNYINRKTFYSFPILAGTDYGGPLFFAHYSYLGFDPRDKKDAYANYFIRNFNHTYINRSWCIENPLNHTGYSDLVWGLTASDNPFGYLAHEPGLGGRDNGTITPTAAIGSIPYAPEIVMPTIYHLYRTYGKDLWGPMGFKDAFNLNENWFASSYLAIDQGPIIGMIENYRTGLLWDNFMANPEIQTMMQAVGFMTDSAKVSIDEWEVSWTLSAFPNPAKDELFVQSQENGKLHWSIIDVNGQKVDEGKMWISGGQKGLIKRASHIPSGLYTLHLEMNGRSVYQKLIFQD